MKATLYTDGASLNNPGPAGIGVVLQYTDSLGQKIVKNYYKSIGAATNNEAEYEALVYGLERCKQFKIDEVTCYSDSELMVKQLNGFYKLHDLKIIGKFVKVWNLKIDFEKLEFIHISREKNKQADRLSKKAAEESKALSSKTKLL